MRSSVHPLQARQSKTTPNDASSQSVPGCMQTKVCNVVAVMTKESRNLEGLKHVPANREGLRGGCSELQRI